jgi:predicted enzyme related to lactoylglutathione lyase
MLTRCCQEGERIFVREVGEVPGKKPNEETAMTHPVVWFEVLGKDASTLQQFYGQLFGWKFDTSMPTRYGTVDPQGGKGIPGGVGEVWGEARPWVTFYVRSNDLGGSLAEAEKLGGKVVMPPRKFPEGPTVAFFSDPEGHVIGLVEEMPS